MSQESKEQKFHDYILNLPQEKKDAIKGKPLEVIKVIDEYPERFMDIGREKGNLIINHIRAQKPKRFIELGGYLGYSAVLFANELIEDPEAKYFSFEENPEFAKIATDVINLAGLSKKIEIIVGKAAFNLVAFQERLKQHGEYKSVDFVFIDHWKDLYVPDLREMETLNLIAPGTMIAADNIIKPGAPEYARYVRLSPAEKKEYNKITSNPNGEQFPGRWNIVYETETVKVKFSGGHEDAVEFTKCIDYLSA
ncbi:hypothetical protein KGF56_000716 [Candida oxycetoniae]|uniref:catechol O-methyltransferase n=1 Tax=Candida oxycetoniae TaxID=497107 RepID=A0AAI9T1E7_9ASCO|nr:uncharacterized protein KGF56_000716 [Candida oxycetoniae]KAI3406584.1 hypothetical protein KGF56_000716 [Candida oxycetoniae]